jgi:protein-L-isoaspartate(D-aspartate) O-methyltransferase
MMRKSGDRRSDLLAEIDAEMRLTAPYTGRGGLASNVRKAIASVPREDFVSPIEQEWAYINRPLPIGHGQTISQPFIVALMTDLLDPEPDDVVLEIGTGSGYQAAVLSKIVANVYSVEVVEDLAASASERLARLGYANVAVRCGDGARGWPEYAPYDGIIVTAAAPEVPPALVMQLAKGGRMVVPVGHPNAEQVLTVLRKDARGEVSEEPLLPVAFVPLVEGGNRGLA